MSSIGGVSAFVVLAVTLAIAALAFTVVVVRELVRNVRKLTTAVRATNERLVPLTDELQSELAVTSVEMDSLNRSVQRLSEDQRVQRQRRARRKKSRGKR